MIDLPVELAGCKIFPVRPDVKVPATKNGWRDARDYGQAQVEWAALNADHNWAVATGMSGLLVVDIDPDGMAWWHDRLRSDASLRRAVENTFSVSTPRGGLHVYFRGEGPSTASRITKGIDTRGGIYCDGKIISGGYVLLPGCRTKDGSYKIFNQKPIVALPDEIKVLLPKVIKPVLAKNTTKMLDSVHNVQWAERLAKSYVLSGDVSVQGTGGNDLAYRVAASILDKAITPAKCLDILGKHWNVHCQPPWQDWELETIVINAYNHGQDTQTHSKAELTSAEAFSQFETLSVDAAPKATIQLLHHFADGVRDPRWLVPGLIPAQGAGILYGESGSYKSFIALDIALCLAHGISGQWGASPEIHDVVFFAGEGPVATAKKRWPAWMQWQHVTSRDAHRFYIADSVPFFTDVAAWDGVKQNLADLSVRPALIVIDTLVRLMTGLDENSAKDASMITNFLENIARYFECFVLAVHHSGKEQSRGARGSSAFFANVDTVISVKKHIDGAQMRVRKQKDADTSEETIFLATKEIGNSIVLEKTGFALQVNETKTAGRNWASVESIVGILQSFSQPVSVAVLVQEIVSRFAVSENIARRTLLKNKDLHWLRDDQHFWRIPKLEYDL